MKLTRFLSTVLFLSIIATYPAKGESSFLQVRNSLWVFGVDDRSSSETEMVGQQVAHFSNMIDNRSAEKQDLEENVQEVPEELDTALLKFES